MMTILLNRIGLGVSMEYTNASYPSGRQWWEACRNLLLVALLGPVELLGLRLVSAAPFPASLPLAHGRASSDSFPDSLPGFSPVAVLQER